VYENFPVQDHALYAQLIAITDAMVIEQTNYRLTLTVIPGQHFMIRLDADSSLYAAAQLERVLHQLQHIIQSVLKAPASRIGGINYLSEAEQQRLLHTFNNTAAHYPANTGLVQLFE